mmetsp:Transcript_8787/g.32407  ORF Transcript_8787/g.32407 Transcript_8787/m.32407 type:complete len:193 (-) Transcript_8787:1284-1862(-)|eukprot:scaffold5337_cov411-Prasinococcus_capsulatus_cf.AAC.12
MCTDPSMKSREAVKPGRAITRQYSSSKIKDGSAWEKLVSMLPISDPEKEREFVPMKHWLVGISCLILLGPSVYLFALREWGMGAAGAAAALLAYHADYVYLAPEYRNSKVKEVVSNLDRVTAFGVTAYVHLSTVRKFGALLALSSLAVFAIFFSYSRRSSTFKEWVNRHTVFHVFVCLHSFCFSYLLYVYNY